MECGNGAGMVVVPLLGFCALGFFLFGPVDERSTEDLYPILGLCGSHELALLFVHFISLFDT